MTTYFIDVLGKGEEFKTVSLHVTCETYYKYVNLSSGYFEYMRYGSWHAEVNFEDLSTILQKRVIKLNSL